MFEQRKNEGAIRYDFNKLRWDLIPFDALKKVTEVYTHGTAKYNDNNWRKGMSYSRMYGSILRHLVSSMSGEDIDNDSGCLHLAQIAWGCLSLIWFQMNNVGNDDRFKDKDINEDLTIDNSPESHERQEKMFYRLTEFWRNEKLKKEQNNVKRIDRIPKPNEIYKHYKGNLYRIISISHNSENKSETLVTYCSLSANEIAWTRPLDMFNEYVDDKTLRYELTEMKIKN